VGAAEAPAAEASVARVPAPEASVLAGTSVLAETPVGEAAEAVSCAVTERAKRMNAMIENFIFLRGWWVQ
jgi:hypothetical protein